jgi:hypothetical protein
VCGKKDWCLLEPATSAILVLAGEMVNLEKRKAWHFSINIEGDGAFARPMSRLFS